MNIQIVGPIGLTAFSLFVSGCADGGGLQDHNPIVPSANVSMFIQSTAPIANVQDLTLQIRPVRMYVDCYPDGDCPYYNLIADDTSVDRSYPSTAPNTCRDVVTGYVDDDPIYEQRCDIPEKSIRLIDMLITTPLGPTPIVRNARIPEEYLRRISHIQLQARAATNVRDSYVHLNDGRECEINIVFPSGADLPLTNFRISNGDELHITLMVEVGTIDPARCETPQDLSVTPVRADMVRM